MGHNIAGSNGHCLLQKGKVLTTVDIDLLQDLGRSVVYVASFGKKDVGENDAALRVAIMDA